MISRSDLRAFDWNREKAIRNQNVGIGVCAYQTSDPNLKPGFFTHFPDSARRQRFSEIRCAARQLANAAPFLNGVSGALRSFYENGAKGTLANYAEA
jgi:hypothetical protein